MRTRLTLSALMTMTMLWCASPSLGEKTSTDGPPTDWRSSLLRDHPLVGTVWNAREGRTATADELAAALAKARFALLGEIHDNPDHHRLQAWEIGAAAPRLARDARSENADIIYSIAGPPLAMEMLSTDQRPQLEGLFSGGQPLTPERFSSAVEWEKSGWPFFALYAPIIEMAFDHRLTLTVASPSGEETKSVSKVGPTQALGEAGTRRLALDQPLDPPLVDALATELKDSHCGMLSDEALPRMVNVQRFRDAFMADALKGRGILIAGDGHVRRDRGVPFYLIRRGVKPDDIVSVIHIEVEAGKTDPASYVPRAPNGTPAADYVWFTPRQDRPDPCEGLREQMKGKP